MTARLPGIPPVILDIMDAALLQHPTVSETLLLMGGRSTHIVAARRSVARALRDKGYSLPVIGRWMGMHHTSIIHLLKPRAIDAADGKIRELRSPLTKPSA